MMFEPPNSVVDRKGDSNLRPSDFNSIDILVRRRLSRSFLKKELGGIEDHRRPRRRLKCTGIRDKDIQRDKGEETNTHLISDLNPG